MIAGDLRNLFKAAKPLVEQWLDLGEEFAALRDAAKEKGIDWSAVKGLLKARAQDEREGGSKHIDRILEKAEFASSYAAMLGLAGSHMNENNFSGDHIVDANEKVDQETGEIEDRNDAPAMPPPPAVSLGTAPSGRAADESPDTPRNVVSLAVPECPDIPEILRRTA